jgi:hypothetical protein
MHTLEFYSIKKEFIYFRKKLFVLCYFKNCRITLLKTIQYQMKKFYILWKL